MWMVWLATVAGICAAVYGVVLLVRTRSFLSGSQRAEGTIVGWRESDGFSTTDNSDTALYPTLRFQAPDGRTIETEAQVPVSSRPDPQKPVEILFNPADPYRARIATHGGTGYVTAVFFIIGGLWLAILPHMIF